MSGNGANGFGPLKPAEQVFAGKKAPARPVERVGVKFERVVSGTGAEKGKPISVAAKAAEIKAKFAAQKAQEKGRGR